MDENFNLIVVPSVFAAGGVLGAVQFSESTAEFQVAGADPREEW